MSWTWNLATADGAALTPLPSHASVSHQTQSDAETWIGEFWRGLVDEGAAQASLYHEGEFVYGPMALTVEKE